MNEESFFYFINFEKIEYTIESQESNPFRCCDTVNCRCGEYGGALCNQLHNTLKVIVEIGIIVAKTVCYTSCSSSEYGTSCSTYRSVCCYCSRDVRNRHCQVVCGTCYMPTVTISYYWRENRLTSNFVTLCSRGSYGCSNEFFNAIGPIGSKHKGYLNPENPRDIRRSNQYRMDFFATFLVFASICIIALTVAIIFSFLKFNKWL